MRILLMSAWPLKFLSPLRPPQAFKLQEVLWNFYLITDKEKWLTLMENPHF